MGYRIDKTQLSPYGHKITWFDDDTPVVSINFYPGKGKYMVQAGGRDPARLDEWLRNDAKVGNSTYRRQQRQSKLMRRLKMLRNILMLMLKPIT